MRWWSLSLLSKNEDAFLAQGESDFMITLVREQGPECHCTTSSIEISKAADQQRLLPDAFLNQNKTMVMSTFYDYATPLIGDPLPIYPQLQLSRTPY